MPLAQPAYPDKTAPAAMKRSAAGSDSVCSQWGPSASLMSQATNHVTPTVAEIAATCLRAGAPHGASRAGRDGACALLAQGRQDGRPDDNDEGQVQEDRKDTHALSLAACSGIKSARIVAKGVSGVGRAVENPSSRKRGFDQSGL